MFEDCLLESAGKIKTNKTRTVAVSATVHGFLIAVLILVPLVFTDQIEGARLTSVLLEPPPPPPGPPPAPAVSVARTVVQEVIRVDPSALIVPSEIPKDIATIIDPAPGIAGTIGVFGDALFGSDGVGVPGGKLLISTGPPPPAAAPPVAPPRPPAPVPPPAPTPIKRSEPLRVGGDVQAGKVIYQPAPSYPSLARVARVEGAVVLQATIGANGTIRSLRIISAANPLLQTGVIEMVKTWKYKPTLLNNEPVEVLTTITINFNLQRDSR